MEVKFWKEYKRDDLSNIPFMIEEGYTPVFHERDIHNHRTDAFNPPHNEVGFFNEKTSIRIWKIYKFGPIKDDGFRDIIMTWRSAYYNSITNRFVNHKSHDNLLEVVEYYKNKENER